MNLRLYRELDLNLQDEILKEDLYKIISSSYKNFNHSKIAPIVKIDDKGIKVQLSDNIFGFIKKIKSSKG